MFKLFRLPLSFIRLYESKQNPGVKICSRTFATCINPFNLLGVNKSNAKCYSTLGNQGNIEEDEILKGIVGSNPDLEHKLKILMLEMEVLRQDERDVPSNSFMKQEYWEELLKLATRTGRKKYLTFLFKLEKKKENIQVKKEQKRVEKDSMPKPSLENGHIIYSLANNNILLRVYDTTINHLDNNRLVQAMMFGQQIVVDCGYGHEMNNREKINCAKQFMFLFSDNRAHEDPFDLHFCNFSKEDFLAKAFYKQIPTMYEPWFPLNIHEKSYLDVFPKNKLIYLTPDAKEEMLEYDHDAVYIIGGIVDKTKNDPLSLAKAKREGLKKLKLPLDRYLQFGAGSGKSLTLNQMILILLDMKRTGNWNYALRHVPKRKLVMEEEEERNYSSIRNNRTLRYDEDDDGMDRRKRDSKFKAFRKKKTVDFSNNNNNNDNKRINFRLDSVLSK